VRCCWDVADHTNVVGGAGEERDNLNSPFSEVGAGCTGMAR